MPRKLMTAVAAAALPLAFTFTASAACIDDIRVLQAETATGSIAAEPGDNVTAPPQTSPNPSELLGENEDHTTVEELAAQDDATGGTGTEFDTALQQAYAFAAAGDEVACYDALARARNAM